MTTTRPPRRQPPVDAPPPQASPHRRAVVAVRRLFDAGPRVLPAARHDAVPDRLRPGHGAVVLVDRDAAGGGDS